MLEVVVVGHFLAYPFPLYVPFGHMSQMSHLQCFLSVVSVKQTTYAMTVAKAILFAVVFRRIEGTFDIIWMPCSTVHNRSTIQWPTLKNSIPAALAWRQQTKSLTSHEVGWWMEKPIRKVLNTSDLFMKHSFTRITVIMCSFFVKQLWIHGQRSSQSCRQNQAMTTSAHPPNMIRHDFHILFCNFNSVFSLFSWVGQID